MQSKLWTLRESFSIFQYVYKYLKYTIDSKINHTILTSELGIRRLNEWRTRGRRTRGLAVWWKPTRNLKSGINKFIKINTDLNINWTEYSQIKEIKSNEVISDINSVSSKKPFPIFSTQTIINFLKYTFIAFLFQIMIFRSFEIYSKTF